MYNLALVFFLSSSNKSLIAIKCLFVCYVISFHGKGELAPTALSAYIDILVMYRFHKTHMTAEFKIPYPASTLKTQILSSQNSTPTFMQITFFVSKITTKSKKKLSQANKKHSRTYQSNWLEIFTVPLAYFS